MASNEWPFANAWSLHRNKDVVSRYEILERIGEGTYGEVHRARRREDSLIVALKEIHNSESSSREIRALLLLDHPNVVKLHEYFAQGSNMVLVLEYLPYNLSEVIRAGKGELSDGELKGWVIQIFQGLAACQAALILHRDLKPNNLLISEDRTLKIADFGQARVLSDADFVNEGEVCGSESHKNYLTASEEGQKIPETAVGRDDRELEFQGDASIVDGRMGDSHSLIKHAAVLKARNDEQSGDSSGAGKGTLSTKPIVEMIPSVTDVVPALRDSDTVERNVPHLGSGPANVGFSVLADAVKDARNYFTIEEMVRSGTGMDGLGLSGLQRQHIIGSHTEDPGCCGWFPMENAENHHSATTVLRIRSSSGSETTRKHDTLSIGRDHQGREREDNFSSDDEGDVDWKGKYGIRNEDLIGTLKKTEETHKGGVSYSSARGGDGDFLQKLRRFIRKRTRRLNTEGEKISGGPVHSLRNERISAVGVGNNLEVAQRDGHRTLHMRRSPGSRKSASITARNSVNAKFTPSTSGNIVPSQDQQLRKGIRHFQGKERKHFKVQFPANDGGRLESMDELSAVSGFKGAHAAEDSLVKEGGGLTLPKKPEDEVTDNEENGDLRTESGRKLYGGLQVEKVEKSMRNEVVVNGPLREMAYARVRIVGEAATGGQSAVKDNFRVDESDVETGGGLICLMDSEKSSTDQPCTEIGQNDNAELCGNDFPWSDQRVGKSPGVPPEDDVLGANESAIPSTWGTSWKGEDNPGETVNGRSEGSFRVEPVPVRDVCKSWTQTECNSTLSDAEIEGTRWYGAPEFQYSYMDSRSADHPADGRVHDEIYGRVTGSEEEWEEESSEDGTMCHKNVEDYSQDLVESGSASDFTTMVGTRWYKAPELLYGATKYGMGIDIWAVGCIFGELLWGKPLFPGLNDIDQLSRVVRILGSPSEKIWAGVSLLPDFNKICFVDERSPLSLQNYLPPRSEAALDFLQKLLTYDPLLRPTAEKALGDEFFIKQPLPCPCHELQLPTKDDSEASDEDWGKWKDPGSPFSDFEILG